MQEYVTDAIVLTKRPAGELDGQYALFTKRFGKMTGRTTSTRKLTSKLCAHLEPGNAIKARFIEQKGTRIVDALKMERKDIGLHDLELLAHLLPEMDPDAGLWEHLAREPFSWVSVLKLLGWDPEGATCAQCGKSGKWESGKLKIENRKLSNGPAYFQITTQEFFCENCVSNASSIKNRNHSFLIPLS